MSVSDIKLMRDQLLQQVEKEMTPEQFVTVKFAKADIENVVKSYGDCGKVALSLCAADFAAED